MLPKEQRLRDNRDFKRVYQKGSFFSTALFTLNFLINKTQTTRLGIVVTKKVEPKATARNKTKRQFREASRELYAILPKGYDVIVTIKKPATEAKFSEIKAELEKGIGRIK